MAKEIRALVVRATGHGGVQDVPLTLDALQEVVGGYLEQITLSGCVLYCDEEGKPKGSPLNWTASALARRLGWGSSDVLRGTVMFLGSRGNAEADVPEEVLEAWRAIGEDAKRENGEVPQRAASHE